MLRFEAVNISTFLKKRFLLFLSLKAFDIALTALFFALLPVIIIPFIFAAHPLFADYQALFSFLFRHGPPLIFALYFLLVFSLTLYVFPLKKFIYLWELHNYDLIKNQISALLFPATSFTEPHIVTTAQTSFTANLLTESYQKLPLTKIYPLLPIQKIIYKTAILAILIIWLPRSTNTFLPAIRHLLNPNINNFQISFPQMKKSYLKNQAFQLQGMISPEPFFPLQVTVFRAHDEQIIEKHTVHNLTSISEPAHIESGHIEPDHIESNHIESNTSPSKFNQNSFSFSLNLSGFPEDIIIKAQTGSASSSQLLIRLVDFPSIHQNFFTVNPPEYSDEETITTEQLPFSILAGSHINHELHFNKNLQSFHLSPETDDIVIKSISPNSIGIDGLLTADFSYELNFTDFDGFSDTSPLFKWRVQKDQAPRISVFAPKNPLRIKAGQFQFPTLETKLEDDLKIKSAWLEIRSRQRFEMTYLSQKHEIPLSVDSVNMQVIKTEVNSPYFFLAEGDRISWNVMATDFFPSREATRSETGSIIVPYFFEEHEEAERQSQEIIQELETMGDAEKSMEEQSAKIQSALQDNDNKFFSRVENQMQEFLQERQENIKKALEIKEKIEQHLVEEQENKLLDEGSLRKLFQVQELYEEIIRDMQLDLSAMQYQAESAPSLSQDKLQEMMQSFDKNQFSSEIDRNLEALKKVHARRQVKKNIARLKHLMEKHQEMEQLLASQKSLNTAEITEKQELWEQVKKELHDLTENPYLPDSMREKLKKELLPQEDEISQQYEQLQQANEQQNMEKAMKHNQALQNKLQQLHNAMQEEYKASSREIMHIDLQKLHLFISEALHLAEHLLFTARGMRNLDGTRLKQFTEENLSLYQGGLNNILREMTTEYQENLNFQGIMLQVGNLIQEKLHNYTARLLSEHIRLDTAPLLDIRLMNNQLALLLIQLKKQLEEQQDDLDMESYLESLEQLLQQQRQIKQKTQEMPSFAQSPSMRQKMMEQLAFQQQLVRESTEKLYQQYQKKMELATNLNAAAEEMSAVEKRLLSGDDGAETQNLQEKIEYRLLEAQNAMTEQKESTKRKGRAAEISEMPQQGSLQQSETEKDYFINALKNIKTDSIPVSHQKIAHEYFQQLQSLLGIEETNRNRNK